MSTEVNTCGALRHPWTYTKEETIRVEDVYPLGVLIPEGYTENGFRPPLQDETYLTPMQHEIGHAVCNHSVSQPRILLKQKDLCFKVGDCFEVRNNKEGRVVSYIRVTHELGGDRGKGLLMFRSFGKEDRWYCEDSYVSLSKKEVTEISRREISRREFDALFIEKIVTRMPA